MNDDAGAAALMARGFGATLGVGASDKITSALATSSALRSYAIRSLRNGAGGGSAGRMWATELTGTPGTFNDTFDVSTTTYRFLRWWTTQFGLWTIVAPSISVWHSIVLTYDGSSAANNPVVYVDGASVTVTRSIAPTGDRDDTGTAFQMGNEPGGTRNWDGSLAEFAVWDRLLTATECNRLGIGYSPAFFPEGRVEYVQMRIDNVGQAGTPTIVGTAIQTHPPTVIDTMPHHQAGARAAILAH